MERKVIFIMGAAHCGSTLLDLILGSHSKAFSLGELHYIGNHLDKTDNNYARICGVCVDRCSFWNDRVAPRILTQQFSHKNRLRRLISKVNLYRFNFYEYLMQITNADILIDSSKGPEWIRQQLKPFYLWSHIEPILIYLCRDGRAVCNSLLRKYPERGMEYIAQAWKRDIEERNRYFTDFKKRKLKIHYKDLASNPASVVRDICDKISLPYEAEMLEYWRHEHHPVDGGNLGTRSLIFQYRENSDPKFSNHWSEINKGDKHYSKKHYSGIGLSIKPDFRWKFELRSDQLETFDSIAGEINRPFAFPN